MDHKELIEQLKNIRFLYADNGIKCEHVFGKAAALIETILEEWDAAVEDLTRICKDNPDACQCAVSICPAQRLLVVVSAGNSVIRNSRLQSPKK